MIIGMVPMALGLGDGGEENAPLGRAVIGGLMCATLATLFFVPAVFSLLHRSKTFGPTRGARRKMITVTEPVSKPSQNTSRRGLRRAAHS
jgi:hypothetical protein